MWSSGEIELAGRLLSRPGRDESGMAGGLKVSLEGELWRQRVSKNLVLRKGARLRRVASNAIIRTLAPSIPGFFLYRRQKRPTSKERRGPALLAPGVPQRGCDELPLAAE